jgi:hypothetical protein
MGEKQPNPITIDGTEYDFNDLTEEQQVLFRHNVDLDRKIANAQFNLDQLMVGKEAFMARLKASLEAE